MYVAWLLNIFSGSSSNKTRVLYCFVMGVWRDGLSACLSPLWLRVRSPDSVICELSLLVLPCFEGFPPSSLVFLPPQKPTLNSNSISERTCTLEGALSIEALNSCFGKHKIWIWILKQMFCCLTGLLLFPGWMCFFVSQSERLLFVFMQQSQRRRFLHKNLI
jgi:hypothetical protein